MSWDPDFLLVEVERRECLVTEMQNWLEFSKAKVFSESGS